MTRSHWFAWMIAGLVVAGCDDPPVPPPPAPATTASASAPPPPAPPLRQSREAAQARGHVLFDRAQALEGLSDEQKKGIEALAEAVDAAPAEEGDPLAPLHAALAAGFRAGAIDDAAVGAAVTSLESEAKARRSAFFEQVAKLHALLTPEQRQKLVEGLKARMDAFSPREPGAGRPHRLRRGAGRDPDARRAGPFEGPPHGIHSGEAREEARKGRPGRESPGTRDRGRRFAKNTDLHRLVRDLGLSAEQDKKLRELRADSRDNRSARDEQRKKLGEMREQMQSIAGAFATDSFDAARFAAMDDPSSYRTRLFVDAQVNVAKGLIQVLTKEQLTKLADELAPAE